MSAALGFSFWGEWELQSKLVFDGPAKLITVAEGVTSLDIRSELYTDWVDWAAVRDNSRYLPAMRFSGLDPIPGGFSGDIYFLQNGWRLVIDLAAVKITGVLYSDDFDSAYYDSNLNAIFPAVVSALVNNASGGTATVDIDAIADAVAAKFAEPGITTDVIATTTSNLVAQLPPAITEKALNRIVQGAVPPPPSNGAIAAELAKIMPKQKDYSAALSELAQRINKLSKPKPKDPAIAEISQTLRVMMAELKPIEQDNTELLAQLQGIQDSLEQMPKELPDYTKRLDDIATMFDQVSQTITESAMGVREEIKAIPETDISSLATQAELEALRSLTEKLQNYDDSMTAEYLAEITETLLGVQGTSGRTERKVDLVLDNQY